MIEQIARVTVLVKDQDAALAFYTKKLGMKKRADMRMGDFRWLTVAPGTKGGVEMVLLPVEGKKETAQVGKGTTTVLFCDNCRRTYAALKKRGVKFHGAPEAQPWGTEVVFEDLYGNPYDLVQP